MERKEKKYWIDNIENDFDKSILKDIFSDDNTFLNFEDVYASISELKSYKSFDKNKAWQNISSKKERKQFSFVKYAAAILVLIGLGLAYYLVSNDTTEFASGSSEMHLVLDDGTDVVLSPDSKLIIANDFGDKIRQVSLEGDAYFDVAKNKTKPFVINTPKASIQVLGTVFYVDQESNSVTVDLISGKVKVKDDKGHEVKIVSKQSAIVKDNITVENIIESKEIEDNYRDLTFDNIKISDAINELNRIYNKKIIELEDNDFGNNTIHITLKNSSVREFINGLKLVFNVDVINSKGMYIIKTLKK